MARDHARLSQTIWSDPDFRALPGEPQRMYFLALSQPGLNYCGVVPYTVRRWARLAKDSTETKVRKAVRTLVAARYVLVDEDSEELWVRSFIKNDGLLGSPNICRAVVKAFPTIHSPLLRAAFLAELYRLAAGTFEDGWEKGWAVVSELIGTPFPEGFPEGLPEGFGEGLPLTLREGFGEGFGESCARAAPSPYPDPVLSPKCEHDLFPGLCRDCRGMTAGVSA